MICVVCRQAETVAGLTRVAFGRDEFRLLVNHVPARVCPSCGEAYVEEATAQQLLRIAREEFDTGISNAQCEYRVL